jgi:uncharacterized membrane protein
LALGLLIFRDFPFADKVFLYIDMAAIRQISSIPTGSFDRSISVMKGCFLGLSRLVAFLSFVSFVVFILSLVRWSRIRLPSKNMETILLLTPHRMKNAAVQTRRADRGDSDKSSEKRP